MLGCLARGYDVLALVKPQFEVGRERVGKGGVVRDAGGRRDALLAVGEAALGARSGRARLPLLGPARAKGNRETFIWLAEPGRARGAGAIRPRSNDGARGGAVRERLTVFTHRNPADTGPTLARLVELAARPA